jgi:subtilase family serine protease
VATNTEENGGHASLAPGEVSDGNVRFEWTPTHVADFVWRFEADVDGHVAETDQTNNFYEVTVYVACAPGDVCPTSAISAPPGGAK